MTDTTIAGLSVIIGCAGLIALAEVVVRAGRKLGWWEE